MNKVAAHTKEWYEARAGRFTASNLYKLICEKKRKKYPRPYVLEKAAEIQQGKPIESDYVSPAMLHGIENEPLAVKWYAHTTKHKIEDESSFIMHPTLLFGATADRYAYDHHGDKLVLEVKCPESDTHLLYCVVVKDAAALKELEPKYYWQIVGGAIVGECKKAAFVSFDPRVKPECGLFVLHFDIPEQDFEIATKAIEDGEKDLKEILQRLTVAA